MEPSMSSNEVNQNCTLTPYLAPNIVQEIKKEMCDEDLTTRADKYDDFDFEPFHENIFRSLSANFDNESNISEINDACLKLESCFIENNILDKNGLSKISLKGSPSSCIFFKYRDIDDAFVDMVISESVGQIKNNNFTPKKIDLRPFKDNFFSSDLADFHYEDPQSQKSDSDSELMGEAESPTEHNQSDVTDGECSDFGENDSNRDVDLLGFDNSLNSSHYDSSFNFEKETDNFINSSRSSPLLTINDSPLKRTVRDVRVLVEKLHFDLSQPCNINEEGNHVEKLINSSRTDFKIRQVARKKTGGMVINKNLPINNGAESSKHPKSNDLLLKEVADSVPNSFDKMTRAGKRSLEKVIAESKATVEVQPPTPSIPEAIHESKPCEKDTVSSSSEDESCESEISKTKLIVRNIIHEFLNKSKVKNLAKLEKDIAEVIAKEVIPLKVKNKDSSDSSTKLNSVENKEKRMEMPPVNADISLENKIDTVPATEINSDVGCSEGKNIVCTQIKSNDKVEESNAKKVTRENPRAKKKMATKSLTHNSRKTLQEFEEIARDIINCEFTTPLVGELDGTYTNSTLTKTDKDIAVVDTLEEPRRPITRQSLTKGDKDILPDGTEEPKRHFTRQFLANNDKDNVSIDDEVKEPRKPITRQSLVKNDKDISVDIPEEPRRPITRNLLAKSDKDIIFLEEDAEEPRRPLTRQSLSKIDKDIVTENETEETREPGLSQTNSDKIIVSFENENKVSKKPNTRQSMAKDNLIDVPLEEPRRPKTRQFLIKNGNDAVEDETDELRKSTTYQLVTKCDTDDTEHEELKRPATRQSISKSDKESIATDQIEPKKTITRMTVAKMERSVANELINSLKDELEEPRRRTTRQSLQRQNEMSKDSSENIVSIELKSAPKRKSNPRAKKSASKKSVTNQKKVKPQTQDGSVIDDEVIIIDINDDSTVSLSDIEVSKASKRAASSFSDRTIKASADSTTSDVAFNEECANHGMTENDKRLESSGKSGVSTERKIVEEDSPVSKDTIKNIGDFSPENSMKIHVEESSCLPDTSLSISNVGEPSRDKLAKCVSNLSSYTTDNDVQKMKDVSKLVEDLLDTSIQENLKQTNETSKKLSSGESEKSEIPVLKDGISDKKTSHSAEEPFQTLNDMITDIEERLLKEDVTQLSKTVENTKHNSLQKEDFKFPSIPMEISADSTSFLNYTLDDSFKLVIDEMTPPKEKFSVENDTAKPKDCAKSNRIESNVTSLNEDVIRNELLQEKDHDEETLTDLKIVSNDKPSLALNNSCIDDKIVSSPSSSANENPIDHKTLTNELGSTDCKIVGSHKPLTNEEKIAQLTKRDPRSRLNNDKKITTVMIRDPRLRNKLPITEEKMMLPSVLKEPVTQLIEQNQSEVKTAEKLSDSLCQKQQNSKLKFSEHKSSSSKTTETKVAERKNESKLNEQKSDSKLTEQKCSEPKPDKPQTPEISEVETDAISKTIVTATSGENDVKESVLNSPSSGSDVLENDQNRRKKLKKTVDEELIYKTPLSDLHDAQGERSTYERDFKKKRLFPEGRKVRIVTEVVSKTSYTGRAIPGPRRNGQYEEVNVDRREYNQLQEAQNSQIFQRDRKFVSTNVESEGFRRDNRYYHDGDSVYEERTYHPEEREQSFIRSNENYEQESYVRRVVTETSFSGRSDFQDNHIYSRREFYRRNRYSHDHDHFGNSSRFVENFVPENQSYLQTNRFPAIEKPSFNISAYPPFPMLPEPMYSQEQDFDQSYGNMETESFSPPSSDLCPPPPLIRSPTPELVRRDKYCPSPPRIGVGRGNSPDKRDYDECTRSYNRNYENDERNPGFRGRNSNINNSRIYSGSGSNFRRGNGRDYQRWREESPPRKRFAGEYYRNHDEDRGAVGSTSSGSRWRRSPSWSPERLRRWSRSPSPPPTREQHPWNSPTVREHPWNSPPLQREQHPWNSPRRSPSPPRRRDNYRDRPSYYHRY